MNFQILMQLNMLLMSYLQMKADGKIDHSEMMTLVNMTLSMLNISLGSGELISFEELDGDFHIIIKKSLRDKIGF